jgi:hypothetical protein
MELPLFCVRHVRSTPARSCASPPTGTRRSSVTSLESLFIVSIFVVIVLFLFFVVITIVVVVVIVVIVFNLELLLNELVYCNLLFFMLLLIVLVCTINCYCYSIVSFVE